MLVSRARLVVVTLAVASVVVFRGGVHGDQRYDDPPFLILQGVGLPAVNVGVMQDETHAPDAPEALRRAAMHAAIKDDDTPRMTASFRPGRVIVRFRDEASAAARLSAVRDASASGTIAERASHADFDIVHLAPGDDPVSAAQQLMERHSDVVMYAQPSYRMHTMFKPNDPLYASNQWNLPMIDLERAWDIQPAAGSTITVAVVDSGLAYQDATIIATVPGFRDEQRRVYPPLGRVMIPYSAARQVVSAANPGRIVAPRDFIWDNTPSQNTPFDFDGHGTHVSGTIGQLTNDGEGTAGVAFNVKLMPVKVIDSVWDFLFGAPNEATDDVVARGVRYAADNGAKIINMSIGRTGPPAPVLEDAIKYAVGKGAFIAIAAGNSFEDGNPLEVVAEIASRVKGAVSVGAVDRARNRAFYSTTGSYVELVAPGGALRGFGLSGGVYQQTFQFEFTDTFLLPPAQYRAPRFDVIGYIPYTGTSMATPHVSGAAAMLMQQGITDPAAIEEALEKYAVDLGAPGRDDQFGFGLIDVRNAMFGLGLGK